MKRFSYVAIWGGALALIAVALLVFESDFLWKVEETSLFLSTPLYFQQQMLVPGGFLSYLGCFFTQYLYHPWMGVLILCAWWWLLMWLTKRCFRISSRWASQTLLPVAFLLMAIINVGYWVYLLKLHGYFFVATLGTTAVVALLWGYRSLPTNRWMRMAYIALTVAVGYPLMGMYALAAAVLMGIWTWRLTSGGHTSALLCLAVAVLCVIGIPLLYYRYVYYQISTDNLYWAALPRYFVIERYDKFYLPFFLLGIYYLLQTMFYRCEKKTGRAEARPVISEKKPTKNGKKPGKDEKKPHKVKVNYPVIVQGVIGIALAIFIWSYWYKDENFHRELAMQRQMERLDWQGMLDEAAKQKDEPTRGIVSMRNLALSRLGRQGNEMFHYKNGSKPCNFPLPVNALLVDGIPLYYHYGLPNLCYRLCIENSVEFNWRVETLKMLAKSCILNGEDQLARKFLDRLKKTRFHKEWAEHWEQLIGNKEAMATDPEMGFITHMMHYENTLGSDQGKPEFYIMKQLVFNQSDDPVFQEQALLATLWLRDDHAFWPHLKRYMESHPGENLPRYYQEAAYLFSKMDSVDVSHITFNPGLADGFNQFMRMASLYEGADMKVTREAMYPQFGETYYYDYYLMSNL